MLHIGEGQHGQYIADANDANAAQVLVSDEEILALADLVKARYVREARQYYGGKHHVEVADYRDTHGRPAWTA